MRLRGKLVFDFDFGDDGEAGAQDVVAVLLLEVGEIDADGDTLDDFDVVAGGVLGWEVGLSLEPVAPPMEVDLAVEGAAHRRASTFMGDVLAGVHSWELGLFEVGGDPEVGGGG